MIIVIFLYLKMILLLKIENLLLLNRLFIFWFNCSEMLDIVVDVGFIFKFVIGLWEF